MMTGLSPLSNADIAELLALRGEDHEDRQRARAYMRASRAAFTWPVEVAELVAKDLTPAELPAIGPRLARLIEEWLEDPPEGVEVAPRRGDFLTLTEARAALEADPEWARRAKGDLQMHTLGSDGRDSTAAMAEAARARGYEFIAITDHSRGLKIAGGMDEPEFALQALEIEALNAAFVEEGDALRVLRGIELNLNPDGEGDMEPAFLQGLDFVIGSFHSSLQTKEDQTDRYLKAVSNPHINVLGHPRGRMYDRRAGLNADWPRVFAAAAEHGTAMEIDGYPDRQDLQLSLLRDAAKSEVLISVGTDAHSSDQLWFMEFALAAALIAGIPAERIINFWELDRLLAWSAR